MDDEHKQAAARQAAGAATFLRWVRQIHFYTSLPLAAVFLFYALSGFLANRKDWFADGPVPTVQYEDNLPSDVALTAKAAASERRSIHHPSSYASEYQIKFTSLSPARKSNRG